MMEIYFGYNGKIRVEPHIWLQSKGTLGNLRKMLRLSAESDREHGTATLAEWETAVRDNYQEDSTLEPRELYSAEVEHKIRLRAAVEWRDARLRKEEERYRKAKVHRGKSHAERVQEIEEKYRQMIAAERCRYPCEVEAARKRAARRREQAAAQLAEIRKFMEEVAA